jgi:hypothetical protein
MMVFERPISPVRMSMIVENTSTNRVQIAEALELRFGRILAR